MPRIERILTFAATAATTAASPPGIVEANRVHGLRF
jgi:hypothetical protein